MAHEVVLVVARAANGVIGRDGALPWHIPADLKRFKALTLGTPMIMGRKTFESLPGLLPGRRHIVMTRSADWHAEGAEVARDAAEALEKAGSGRVSVIGGGEVYRRFLPLADRLEVTEVREDTPGDTSFPDIDPEVWTLTNCAEHEAADGRPAHAFATYERREPRP